MAAKIVEIKDSLNKSLRDGSKPWTFLLDMMESKTGVDRMYIFVAAVGITTIWLIFGFAAQLVCNCIGFIYPAYVSIHAIESHNKDDDTKWLTYWVIFAFFSILEFFADTIVGWFPLYWLAKCSVMVWLMIPTEFNGSIILYNRIVRPYFLKHHAAVDQLLDKAKQAFDKKD
ncbi:receptor expression-enhancing protein 5 isoform X2 [Onthophagus taurus]|uniref:receptor expression-enhancing protein 5 isoform X2 n=1 Tax=Onthophagus taurus TaxID=166361 RepID=UPI000C1FD9FC|nr:receptor expression-enhancing protein 5 isoform X2 [Onthophagus taurus]